MPKASSRTTLWNPSTPGEEVFLCLHRALGLTLSVSSSDEDRGVDLDCLGSKEYFAEFVQLSATTDVFVRCIIASREVHHAMGSAAKPDDVKRSVKHLDLPISVNRDRVFVERLFHAGKIASERSRRMSLPLQKAMVKDLANCYICGKKLIAKAASKDDKHAERTADHLWPLCFGGSTSAENLLPACFRCNNVRKSLLSWASGPVYNTMWSKGSESASQDQRPNPELEVTIPLALARLMDRASGHRKDAIKRTMTLKEAALELGPIRPELDYRDDKHYVFTDLLMMTRA
jgi:5-methylcytosine-specific restriction endonuclease McrA